MDSMLECLALLVPTTSAEAHYFGLSVERLSVCGGTALALFGVTPFRYHEAGRCLVCY